ncbi:hypothetical protein D3C73_517230 [compost metagenome]
MSIPNLQGESLRDAMELLSVLGVPVTANGQGYVVSQTVTNENGERRINLTLEPLMPTDDQTEGAIGDTAEEDAATEGEAAESSP